MDCLSLSDDTSTTMANPALEADEVRTNLPSYSNFPRGHIMRMIGRYNTNTSALQASTVPMASNPSPEKAETSNLPRNPSPEKAETPNLPNKRAALIAKARAAQNGAVFAAPSAGAKRSARRKTANYKPILAAGKGSLARLSQMHKSAAEKATKEQEDAAALEKKDKAARFLDNAIKQLLQRLPDEAVADLPDDFYKLAMKEKLRVLLEAHVEYRKDGLGDVAEEMGGKAKGMEDSGHVLGVSADNACTLRFCQANEWKEIEQLEELQEMERSLLDAGEHDDCVSDECKEFQRDVGGGWRIVDKIENSSQ